MNCPTCQVDLVMSERQGIEIDYCPKCRGVWLDRGELDKIIEKSGAELSSQSRHQEPPRTFEPRDRDSYSQLGYGYGHKKPHRRKSWLEEIFD